MNKRSKWRRWLRVIERDVAGLLAWREQFAEAIGRLDRAGDGELERAAGLLRETYAHAMAMGIRRQLKLGSRNISLAGLLTDLAENATDGAAQAEADLRTLRRDLRAVEAFADRAVAHADRRVRPPLETSELDAALDALRAVFEKYAERLGEPRG